MKNTAFKKQQKTLNKFSKLAITPKKSKKIKGGNNPIIFEDVLDS